MGYIELSQIFAKT